MFEALSEKIIEHYCENWDIEPNVLTWNKGPIETLNDTFKILEFPPCKNRDMWTYATVAMSNLDDVLPIEVHIFSSKQDRTIVELLYAIAYYHQKTKEIKLNDTVFFGRSWQDDSLCKHGLISLPYLDGPNLELMIYEKSKQIKFYWLIPLTYDEVQYKNQYNIDALEEILDTK
jgi:hypothetical protein